MEWNEEENCKNLEATITEPERPMKIPKAWHKALFAHLSRLELLPHKTLKQVSELLVG